MSEPVVSAHEEHFILNLFWLFARPELSVRVDMLRWLSSVAVKRPADWRALMVRHEFEEWTQTVGYASECFGCLNAHGRPRAWHHIIQVQHGGSNSILNLVTVCDVCHARIHPWLTHKPVRVYGWTKAGDLIQPWMDEFEQQLARQKQQA